MAEVSHSGRRKRPWTAQEQATLEVAAACGVPMKQIGVVLDRRRQLLYSHVGPGSSIEAKQAEVKRVKAWNEANRERKAANGKAWYEANRERRAATSKAWCKANPERRAAYVKAWRARNPERANDITRRRESRLRIARKFSQITYQQKEQRFALWQDCCAYCGVPASHPRNIGRRRLSVDHVLAILHGGLDQPDNAVPACRSCNSSKQASPVEDWYRAQPFFSETRWRKIQQHCPAAATGQLSISIGA